MKKKKRKFKERQKVFVRKKKLCRQIKDNRLYIHKYMIDELYSLINQIKCKYMYKHCDKQSNGNLQISSFEFQEPVNILTYVTRENESNKSVDLDSRENILVYPVRDDIIKGSFYFTGGRRDYQRKNSA